MFTDHEPTSDLGIVGFWDASTPPKVAAKISDCVESLREQARKGSLFFIHDEHEDNDPVRYRIHLFVDEEPPESIFADYESTSGSHKLALPSGSLVIAGVKLEGTNASSPSPPLTVAAGDYVLTVFSKRPFDHQRYKAKMEKLVGAADYRYQRNVSRVGATGCLTTLLAILSIIIPATRRYWWITIPVFLAPWLTYLVLARLPRYRRIEKTCRDFEPPQRFIIALKRSDAVTELAGGWIRPP